MLPGVFILLFLASSAVADGAPPCVERLATPDYPRLATLARVQGVVQARFSVDSTGRPTNISTEGHKLLTPAIVRSLEASTLDAESCAMKDVSVSYHFEIDCVRREATLVTYREPSTFTVLSKDGCEIVCMLGTETRPMSWLQRIRYALARR